MDTKTIAAECLTYARRYRCSLQIAINEFEGESERLAPHQKAEVIQYFHAMGMDLDAERSITEVTEQPVVAK